MSIGRVSSLLARTLAAFVALAVGSLCAAAEPDVTAFTHVNIVPMDRERVLRDQTVLVEGGVIAAVGPDVAIPTGAKIVEGRGKFLSPGLADMHSHSESWEDMKVYLASGITTIFNLGGASNEFMGQRRPLLNRGERPGPHVYAAFRIDGTPRYGQFVVTTPDEARWAVRLAKTNGYKFIKVYNTLPAEVFAATADEAAKIGLGVVGHNVDAVRIPGQLERGQSLVAHLEDLMYGLFKSPSDDPLAAPDPDVVSQAVALVRRHHAYVVADLVTFQTIAEQWGHPQVVAGYMARPDAKLVPPEWRVNWSRQGYVNRSGSLDRRAAFLADLAKALADGGVGLLAGTDAPTIPGIVPGISLHDNLDRLVGAGLSRFQALSTATRMPGEYIGRFIRDEPPFGAVRPGYRADLILSEANPLEILETLRTPVGVMRAGGWRDRAELRGLLDQVVADYSAAAKAGGGEEPRTAAQ
jgi:hypothetical protein